MAGLKSTLKAHSPNCAHRHNFDEFSRNIFYGVSDEDNFLMKPNLSHNSVVKILMDDIHPARSAPPDSQSIKIMI